MTTTKEIATVDNTANISVENFSDTTIEGFIASRHSAPNTQKTYRNSIRQMLKYFVANKITAPTTADIDNFVNKLRAAKKSPATIRLYTTITKLYFDYLEREGVYRNVTKAMTPLKLRKSSTHNRKALTDVQAKKLLKAIKGDDIISRRNRAIIALSLTTGVRTVEVARANIADLSEETGFWTLAVQGKGRIQKDELIKVPDPVAEMINEYLTLRVGVESSEPLFTSESHNRNWKENSYGSRLSEQSVGKLIKAAMKSVGINDRKITAHSCRHFAATTAIKSGIDIREISAMLRHSSLVVTSVYLHDLSVQTRRAELSVADVLFGDVA